MSSNTHSAATPQQSYRRPPILAGYTYEPAEAYAARDRGQLLAIRLETNHDCNLRCRYCYAGSSGGQTARVSYEALTDIVGQARELGARSVVVIGGGEPTLHPDFRRLIEFIDSLGMVPVVFSNCLLMTGELAQFLYRHNGSVMTKLDSLRPGVQDFLGGCDGAFGRIRNGIANLIEAGFACGDDPHRLRLGASFVSCRMNLREIDEIWRFCRDSNIFPNMEVLTPTGRARDELVGQGLSTQEIQDYKLGLLDIDRREYGFDWLPHTPLTASGCLQHLYSLYITTEGNVRPCAPTKFDEHPDLQVDGVYPHNVFRRPLREIYNDPLFAYVRHIDQHLQGRCRACRHLNECIGCRGYAYTVGINEGKSPQEALSSQCLQCSL